MINSSATKPPVPGNPALDFLAARLLYRMLGYIFIDELRKG
jgi:hypothetical protein